jgi:acetoin:2,6-dichlorophenolindophenol oxidoreductase subunit alpha
VLGHGATHREGRGLWFTESIGHVQVWKRHGAPGTNDQSTFDDVLELPHISRPLVGLQLSHGAVSKDGWPCKGHLAALAVCQVFGPHRDILEPFPQGGNVNGKYIDAKPEVFPEQIVLHQSQQIAIRRGNHPDVYGNGVASADPLKFRGLEEPQEPDLCRKGKLSYFVEEDGAAVCLLEVSPFRSGGAGKGAPFMTEQFAVEECLRYGPAVDAYHGAPSYPRCVVYCIGNDLFADSRLAGYEDRAEDLLKLYRNMVLCRKMDEAMVEGLNSGKVPGFWHSGQGNEATAVGGSTFLRKTDWVMDGARAHGGMQYVAKGMTVTALLGEHCAKSSGCCSGWSGFHSADADLGVPGACGTVGSTFPIAVGLAISCQYKGQGDVVVAYFGDGASGRGTLHEGFNMAAIMRLPIVWVCEKNGFAIFMPVTDHSASKDIADLAYGYGMPGVVVDGQDVVAVAEAVMSGVERARAGEGPSLVECKTYRFRSHNEGTPILRFTELIPEAELAEWRSKDPILLFRQKLMDRGLLTAAEVEKIEKEADEVIAEADRVVTASPISDPEDMFKSLYAD